MWPHGNRQVKSWDIGPNNNKIALERVVDVFGRQNKRWILDKSEPIDWHWK